MKYLDTRMRIRHPCPFCDLSASHPNIEFALWSGRTNQAIEVSTKEQSELSSFLRDARASLGTREVVRSGNSALIMTERKWKYNTVSQVAMKYRCWEIPPETYYEGWETHRLISPGREALRAFVAEVRRLGEIEVVSHTTRDELSMISDQTVVPIHFFEGLTEKQVKCLVMAYEGGLYELPARTTLEALAKHAHLSRSTLGEHLRKAHLQILRNSYPQLKLRTFEHEPAEPEDPFPRTRNKK